MLSSKSNGPRVGLPALKAYVHGNNKLEFLLSHYICV